MTACRCLALVEQHAVAIPVNGICPERVVRRSYASRYKLPCLRIQFKIIDGGTHAAISSVTDPEADGNCLAGGVALMEARI